MKTTNDAPVQQPLRVSINNLAAYAHNIDAHPSPSDLFTVTLTRSQLEWLRQVVRQQVLTEQKQLDHYIQRDALKHPQRKTIDRFRHRLEIAKDFQSALQKIKRI